MYSFQKLEPIQRDSDFRNTLEPLWHIEELGVLLVNMLHLKPINRGSKEVKGIKTQSHWKGIH